MAKDPAFLFYSSDFLTGISDLTMEERGQYITLLCIQHQKGKLSEKIIKISIGSVSEDVMNKFKKDEDGLYFNERLDLEAKKRAEHGEKQRQRALDGWKKRKATADATALPLEDENVNENRNKVYNKNVNDCLFNCLKFFPNQLHPKENQVGNWLDTIDKLNRIENLPFNIIEGIVKKTREDDFWAKNFLAIPKLRKKDKNGVMYILVFNESIKNGDTKKGSQRRTTLNPDNKEDREWLAGKV